ncbi:MAG: hypothetical protein U1U88_000830 [Lawsonella clevelandensis]
MSQLSVNRGVVHLVFLNPLCVPALLADPTTAPQQLVVVGKPTLHRSVTRLLADPTRPQIVVTAPTAPTEWADVAGQAQTACTNLTVTGESPQRWLAACAEADGTARAHVLDVLAGLRAGQRDADPGGSPAVLEVAYAVGEAVAADPTLLLFVGSSNPVRISPSPTRTWPSLLGEPGRLRYRWQYLHCHGLSSPPSGPGGGVPGRLGSSA